MATEPEEEHPHFGEEDEGGPVKSFLDHLEDFRWALIKSCAAIAGPVSQVHQWSPYWNTAFARGTGPVSHVTFDGTVYSLSVLSAYNIKK